MIGFIDDHRRVCRAAPTCKVLPVAPSGCYARLAVRADPAKTSVRQQTDARLQPKIHKVRDDNWQVCGVRKASRQLCREGADATATPRVWQKSAWSRRMANLVTLRIEPVDNTGSRPLARALPETINGLRKTEAIRRRKSWRTMADVEIKALKWPYGDTNIANRLTDRLVQQPPPA